MIFRENLLILILYCIHIAIGFPKYSYRPLVSQYYKSNKFSVSSSDSPGNNYFSLPDGKDIVSRMYDYGQNIQNGCSYIKDYISERARHAGGLHIASTISNYIPYSYRTSPNALIWALPRTMYKR